MTVSLGEKGIILILTLIIMTTLTAIVVAFLSMISIQTKGSGYDISSHKALWLAEAGLQQVIYKLNNNATYRNNTTSVSGNLGDGSYMVNVTSVTNVSVYYSLISTGTVHALNRRISQTAVVTSAALGGAIHSDAAIIDFTGSSGTVNGDIEAKIDVRNEESMTINGTITEDIVSINPALDFSIYQTIAQSQGQYSTSALTFSNGIYSGVYYTTKGVTIGNNVVMNGSIFAQGAITFANQATNITISPTNNYPALAAQSSISTNPTGSPSSRIGLQHSTIHGLIYSDSNIDLNYLKNNVTVNGTILSDNNINIKNGSNFTINYNVNIFTPMPPGFIYDPGGNITVIPQKDWNEIFPAN